MKIKYFRLKLEISRNSGKESTEFQSDNNSASADGEKSQKSFRRSLSSNFGRKTEDSLQNIGKIFPNKNILVLISEIMKVQRWKVQNFPFSTETCKNSRKITKKDLRMKFDVQIEDSTKNNKKIFSRKNFFVTISEINRRQTVSAKFRIDNQDADSKCKKHDLTPCSDTKN